MAQYIDKSVLIAVIEKLKGKVSDSSSYCNGWQHAVRMLELSLDTLEVKEVDFEKSISDWLWEGLPNDEELIDYIKETAEHFFELGLKAQKGEKV